jgi:di/tricarboxylate transporter
LDRLTLAVGSHCLKRDGSVVTLEIGHKTEKELGFETLSTVDGRIVETVVSPQSPWKGQTLRRIRPRSEYGVQILAMHRNGKNLTQTYLDLPLHAGDTLLLLGAVPAIEQISQDDRNLILLEEHEEPPELETHQSRWAGWVAAGLVLAVVVTSAMEWLPISVASLAACGIEVEGRVAHEFAGNGVNDGYLATKAVRFGHMIGEKG